MTKQAKIQNPTQRLPPGARACYNGYDPMSTEPTHKEDFVSLYRRAFAEDSTRALWNKRVLDVPTPEDALVVARALRIEGNREARRLAEQIE